MKRAMTVALGCIVAVLLPASVAAAGKGNGKGNGKGQVKSFTAKQCNAQKQADSGAFKAAFGGQSGKHAMRDCKRETTSQVNGEFKNAAQECADERDADPEGFIGYGTNDKAQGKGAMRNAFGKCVSGKVGQAIQDNVDEFESAAQQCRGDRALDPAGFLETWGNGVAGNENNASNGGSAKGAERKAFGKCVSSTTRQLEQEQAEEPSPEEEPAPAV